MAPASSRIVVTVGSKNPVLTRSVSPWWSGASTLAPDWRSSFMMSKCLLKAASDRGGHKAVCEGFTGAPASTRISTMSLLPADFIRAVALGGASESVRLGAEFGAGGGHAVLFGIRLVRIDGSVRTWAEF